MDYAVAPYDQDRVGLKGHFNFDIDLGETDTHHVQWPYLIANRPNYVTGEAAQYTRPTYLLPKFYLSVRVMKCPKGKKALIPRDEYLRRHSTINCQATAFVLRPRIPTKPKNTDKTLNGKKCSVLTSPSKSIAAASILTQQA